MAATAQDLRAWFKAGLVGGDKYMIVVCDGFDHSDYPVFCSEEDFAEKHKQFNGENMQSIMEVYDLSLDIEKQMGERRAFHYPPSFAKAG